MKLSTHGDIVASTLEYYRQRTKENDSDVPEPYLRIQRKLEKTVEREQKVLLDIKDSYSVQTVVVRFESVHGRWAMGKSTCYSNGQEVKVPYTVHYSDILCKNLNLKVIVEGENPLP